MVVTYHDSISAQRMWNIFQNLDSLICKYHQWVYIHYASTYRQIKITLVDDLPIHIDGEPWIQPKGQCVILKSALKVCS